MNFSILLFSVLLLLHFLPSSCGPVVGIDIGTMWYKVAMIQGQHMDLVLDVAGDRKRNTWVGIKGDERVFGREAETMLMRYPASVFKNIMDLLGKTPAEVKALDPLHYPYLEKVKTNELRDAVEVFVDKVEEGGKSLTPEEVMAMFIKEALGLASAKAGMKVVDCVFVLPNYFTHHQRQGLLDAAKIAEGNVLAFMNTGTAAGLTYGLNRDKESQELHHRVLFYDMGHSSTTAEVLEFKKGEDHKKNKTVPIIQLLGHGWDESLGGRDFDMKLAKFFARKAEQKLGEGTVINNKRTLERLLRESRKVKEVLSANLDSQISIPDLVPDFDFFSSVKREEFEKECDDLLARAIVPVQQALLSANLTPQDIDFVEVIGGGSRIPSIHSAIAKFLNREDVDRHLNGDEAAVFGASFYAATQSTSFRVKNDILLKDATAYGISVSVADGVSSDHSSSTAQLIKPLNRYGSLKKLSFHVNENFHNTHFTLRLFYESDSLRTDAPRDIAEISFSGLPSKDKFTIVDTPKVTLSFRLSPLGLVVVEHADVEFTILTLEKEKEEKKEDKKDEEGKDETEAADKESKDATENEKSEEKEKENKKGEKRAEDGVAPKTGDEAAEEEKEEKFVEVKRVKKVALKVDVKAKGVVPLSTKEVNEGKKKLRDMDAHDKLKFETEEARNTLETFIYDVRTKIEEDTDLQKYITEKEKEDLMALLEETGAWLYDDGASASLPSLRSKTKHLHSLADPAFNRRSEKEKRDEVVAMFLGHIHIARNQTANITKTHEVEEKEQEEFLKMLEKEEEGIFALYRQQQERALDVDPLFTSQELEAKQKDFEKRVKAFKIRPKRKPKVVKLNITDTDEKKDDEGVASGEESHEGQGERVDETHEEERTQQEENSFDEL